MPVVVAPGTPLTYPFTRPAVSFGHIQMLLAGFPIMAFTGITYGRVRSREMLYGPNADPLGKSLGTNAYKCSLELYFSQFNQAISQLVLAGAIDPTVTYGDFQFDINVTYNAPGFGVVTDIIAGCTWDSSEADNPQSNAALKRKVELSPLKIYFNGQEDNSMPLGIASVFQAGGAVLNALGA